MADPLFLGIDIGTSSARAGLFDERGRRQGLGVHPLQIFRPAEDFCEQSSDDIWAACGEATRAALREAGARPEQVAGVGFDATCSLVVLGEGDRPVTVSPTGNDGQNVIVWMDHRAIDQARRMTETRHRVLRYVGGVMSPEMESPKLLWLKERMPGSWSRARTFLDLADFLTYRATGSEVRSLCTTVCKWTYLGHEAGEAGSVGRWDDSFFEQVGLGDLAGDGHARIGRRVRPLGEQAGVLLPVAAAELGLAAGTAVAVAIIDAHAGGLGMLGLPVGSSIEERLALIGGTSSCHMAVSRAPVYVPGVWGPYFSAMVPGMWLTEGGQSATGALLDHTLRAHAHAVELAGDARARGVTVYALLNERLERLGAGLASSSMLTRGLHVLPDHHGNRSPRADPTLRGMVSGLKLEDSVDALALLYLATVQAIAHGTRHIVDAMNASGHQIKTLIACGGDTKNPLFLREHADITGCVTALPREPEAVLLGAAILGAVAAGRHGGSLSLAMQMMTESAATLAPATGEIAAYHDRKHQVFLRLHDDQVAYGALMRGASA